MTKPGSQPIIHPTANTVKGSSRRILFLEGRGKMEPLWLLAALCTMGAGDAARILVFQPFPARGHSVAMEPFFEELALRGHNITLLTNYPHKPSVSNLNEIDFSHTYPSLTNSLTIKEIKLYTTLILSPVFMSDIEFDVCEKVFSDEKMRTFLESNETYDLVMTEIFTSDCFVPFAYKFKAPLISFVTSSALPWVADRVGLPDNPSYIPNYFTGLSGEMNFLERVYNTITLLYSKFIYYFYSIPRVQKLVNFYFKESVPPITELVKETSLVLINSYFTLSQIRPFPPNVVEIGGILLRSSGKSMPKDLQDVLDRATQGAVVVSFGSMTRMSSLPTSTINAFLEAFSKIPQTVIFKYEEDLPQAPSNVVISKWVPQREIIEHKNLKAVVTHGGLASITESIYFGKPVVGVPLFSDQPLNVQEVVSKGAGVMLDVDTLASVDVEAALKAVLNDPRYAENARRLSHQFRDRPMTPLQSAVYWTEYVIRHQGAPHLRPASVSLSWYQLALLDVIAVLLLPLIPFVYVIYFLFFRAVEVSPNDYRNYEKKKSE